MCNQEAVGPNYMIHRCAGHRKAMRDYEPFMIENVSGRTAKESLAKYGRGMVKRSRAFLQKGSTASTNWRPRTKRTLKSFQWLNNTEHQLECMSWDPKSRSNVGFVLLALEFRTTGFSFFLRAAFSQNKAA